MPCAEIAEAGMLRPRGRGIFGASPGREANAWIANRLRTMIAALSMTRSSAALIARSAVYRFAHGDSRQLFDSFGRISILRGKITGRPPSKRRSGRVARPT